MRNTIAVSLVVDNGFKNVVMPNDLFLELAKELRERGETEVHFASESVMAKGMVVVAKGFKGCLTVLPNLEEDTDE